MIDTAGSGYTLTASSGNLTLASSKNITVKGTTLGSRATSIDGADERDATI
jgi:hypothetical protein